MSMKNLLENLQKADYEKAGVNISGYTEAFSFVQQDSQTSKWCSYFKHILTGKKRRKSDEEKIFQVVSNRIAFFFRGYGDWLALF